MLSIKSIKLPSIHVDFLLLCSCQVSSHSEYFIIIYVSLMSHVGGKTPISDHREMKNVMNKWIIIDFVPAVSVLVCDLWNTTVAFATEEKKNVHRVIRLRAEETMKGTQRDYNLWHLTRVTSLWFFSSFLPMLLRNSFLSWVDPFSQPTLRKKKRLKNVANSIRAFMRSLTQVVMSHVVDRVRFFKLFVDKKLWRSPFLKAVYSDAVCTRYYTRIWTM